MTDRARKDAAREAEAAEIARALAELAPDDRASAEQRIANNEGLMKVANLKRAGFHVTSEVDPGLIGLDLFKEFKRRKAAAAAAKDQDR